jgi:hypothetical protein
MENSFKSYLLLRWPVGNFTETYMKLRFFLRGEGNNNIPQGNRFYPQVMNSYYR